ncbi:MAG TPA: Mur ligase family protein [Bacteroidales bacterium]|nr:Mur ligase family protein [Bacteroidales bacterium]HPS17896.1 Mur ligase family protein [Bacteroidales bacterium]
MKNVHFIAIGGSAMHNLAIALCKKGYHVSGSDDEIFEPSKSRLAKYNLLPAKEGWDENLIQPELDAVILGMHARADNPELLKAQQLGIKVFSYPEYLYEQSKDKIRVVIGGSHGKTTITAMVLHVLNYHNVECDYMVGAQLEGFDVMVKLTESAPYIILEGDEYLTSPIDRRPKFHLYMPDIALISGIAWDHINVFPTFENYVEQFRIFANLISDNGALIYCEEDDVLKKMCEGIEKNIDKIPYTFPEYKICNGITYVYSETGIFPLRIFGKHNLLNLNGARYICNKLGINDEKYFEAISSFAGASKRLELVKKNDYTNIYKDFAHSPSKLIATTQAVKEQFPERHLVACIELHTFSSLTAEFLNEYKGTMKYADTACVYFNPHTIEHKKLPPITKEQVQKAFDRKDILVYTDSNVLVNDLLKLNWEKRNLLLMSSGNFDGINFPDLADKIIS